MGLLYRFLSAPILHLIFFTILGFSISHHFNLLEFDITTVLYILIAYNLLAIGLYGSTYAIEKEEFKKNKGIIISAVTIGVIFKTIFIGALLYLFVQDVRAFLLGVVIAQIDPLSVGNLLTNTKHRLSKSGESVLRAWSSFDDPMSILLLLYFGLPFVKNYIQENPIEFITLHHYIADLALNLILLGIVWSIVRISKNTKYFKQIEIISLIVSFVISIHYKLMIAIAGIGMMLRPQFEKILAQLLNIAFWISCLILGILSTNGINILEGFLLGLFAIIAQAVTALFLTQKLQFKDRIYLAFAQQNGITAILLAVFLEQFITGVVAVVAPAIFFINIAHFILNQIIDEYFDEKETPYSSPPAITSEIQKNELFQFNKSIFIKTKQAFFEVLIIMFLLYANTLMGFYTVNVLGDGYSFWETIQQLFTWQIFTIAFFSANFAYIVIEIIKKQK